MLLYKIHLYFIVVSIISLLLSCGKDKAQDDEADHDINENSDAGVDRNDLGAIHFESATALAKKIREGEITSAELLERFLKRIELYNDEINAVVAMDVDAARARAKEADDAVARGEIWGPLHGLPMTVKDSFEVVGMPATAGDPELADYLPEDNALAVQRLMDAGAIVFGKTNLPYHAWDWQTFNDVYGTTNNPWDLTRTPGGSSGGSAAALSAGFTALELGTDIGGSIRLPSHFTGVYGLKTTFGIVPRLGNMPHFPTSFPANIVKAVPLSVAGPLARSADDLELALDILITPGPSEEQDEVPVLLPPRRELFKDYRVAVWLADPSDYSIIDDEMKSVLDNMVDKLKEVGIDLDEEAHPDIVREDDFYVYSAIIASMQAGVLQPNETLRDLQETHRNKWIEFFKEYDVLLAPVYPTTAFPHFQEGVVADRYIRINGKASPYFYSLGWATLAVVSGLPAAVAPIGLSDSGLPVGVQIICAPYEDRTAIDFARSLSDILEGFTAPPDYDDDDSTTGRNANADKLEDVRQTNGLMFEGIVVTDSKGRIYTPIKGMQICVDEHEEIACATTDERGYYALSGLPQNSELVVTMVAEGYVNTARAIFTEEADMALFPLSYRISYASGLAQAGQIEEALAIINESDDAIDYTHTIDTIDKPAPDPELEINRKLGAIWFRANFIVGNSQVPLSDVDVSIEPKEGDGPYYQGDHSEGYFFNLPAGEYELTFSHPDYNCNSVWKPRGYPSDQDNTIRAPVIAGFQTDPVGVICEAK